MTHLLGLCIQSRYSSVNRGEVPQSRIFKDFILLDWQTATQELVRRIFCTTKSVGRWEEVDQDISGLLFHVWCWMLLYHIISTEAVLNCYPTQLRRSFCLHLHLVPETKILLSSRGDVHGNGDVHGRTFQHHWTFWTLVWTWPGCVSTWRMFVRHLWWWYHGCLNFHLYWSPNPIFWSWSWTSQPDVRWLKPSKSAEFDGPCSNTWTWIDNYMFERFVLRIQNKQRMNMAIEIPSNFDSH